MELSIRDQIIRIILAIIVGSIIGYERMKKQKEPGVRTHAVITVVCTMITMISAYGFAGFPGTRDPARLISNILTGIGFLAGGVIFTTTRRFNLSRSSEQTVVGLTTASIVFGAATLGIPIGLGYYPLVILTLLAIEFSLQIEKILSRIGILKLNKDYLIENNALSNNNEDNAKDNKDF
jgi:putative Mg2+ transporter-C (MgtC) family protein